jgi:hypothetical protein
MDDIFEFWDIAKSGILAPANKGPFPHPLDRDVLDRAPHRFRTECLPNTFMGPLRNAKVVLLFLSPGFSESDVDHAQTKEGRDYHSRQWTGKAALPTEDEHASANRWLARALKQFDVKVEDVANQLAILNIGAYHSAKFHDRHMLAALPSSRVTLGWAQSVLFPEAIKGRKTVICLRSPKFWGLTAGKRYGEALFAPRCTARGDMCRKDQRDKRMRNSAVKSVRSRLTA